MLYNRSRIGHTYLTHTSLLKTEDIFINFRTYSCVDFDIIHRNFYTGDLLHNIHCKQIISVIHAIGLTNKRLFQA